MTSPPASEPIDLDALVAANRLREHQDQKIRDFIRTKAIAGDPMFAVAWALLELRSTLDHRLDTITDDIHDVANIIGLIKAED